MGRLRQLYFVFLFTIPLLPGCATLVRVSPGGEAAAQPQVPSYRGVFHVHTVYSHDSKVGLEGIRTSARKADLDFVVITDHNSRDAAADNETKNADPPLLIIGEEISTGDGHLIAIGTDEKAPGEMGSNDLIQWIHSRGGYAFLAHPTGPRNRWRNPLAEDYDGLEVYNFANSIYNAPVWKLAFAGAFYTPGAFLRTFQQEPPFSGLEMWDRQLSRRPSAAVGAVDSHIHARLLGFAPESLLLMFRAVTVHVYSDALETGAIVDALGKGRSFMVFETKGRADHFLFQGKANGTSYLPGDTVSSGPVSFEINAPEDAYIRLIHNGARAAETHGKSLRFQSAGPGYYRVEVYKEDAPWIISNPIYLEN